MPDSEQEQLPPKRTKGVYIGAPACFVLELAAQHLREAFGDDEDPYNGLYVVGSSLQRPDFRDVDVRYMMGDAAFARLFPRAGQHWEWDARWLVLTTAISKWLSDQTGLKIDFQFQPESCANGPMHKDGRRNAIGLKFAKYGTEEAPEPAAEPALNIAKGDMRWAKEQRMKFIAAQLASAGFVNRRHLMAEFSISPAQASADLALFAKVQPGAMTYNPSTKRFERAA